MMPNITSLTSAEGWYYIFTSFDEKKLFYKVAVWKMDETGKIYGMVAIESSGDHDNRHLVIAPPNATNGKYKHISEITNEEAKELGIIVR